MRVRMPSRDLAAVSHEDQAVVKELFQEFANSQDAPRKGAIALRICAMVIVRSGCETAVTYPAARCVLGAVPVVANAEIRQNTIRNLVESIDALTPENNKFDTYVNLLGSRVAHHAQEEATVMLPLLEHSGANLNALGAAYAAYKTKLMLQMGLFDMAAKRTTTQRVANKSATAHVGF